MLKKGFTLIELLIVIGIISLLVAMEGYIYVSSQRSARNGKRKTDLENIRAALEQYRSTNNSYPQTSSVFFSSDCTANGSLSDNPGNIYIKPLPSDPRCQRYHYYYIAKPDDCNETNPVCNDYTLGTLLEQTSATVCTGDCTNRSQITTCNYCLGPYGAK